MYQKPYLPIALIVFFIISLAGSVIAQEVPPVLQDMDKRFSHSIIYNIGGLITIDRQVGHDQITGAVKYQQVRGYGEMSKVENVRMAAHIINVDETTDWTVPAGALGNLRVTTVIDLASRPMATAAAVYGDIGIGDVVNIYDPAVVSGNLAVNRLTHQIWATAVFTNPGHRGSYHADFIAAYGPGPYDEKGILLPGGGTFSYDEDYMWEYNPDVHWSERDKRSNKGYERGDYYVGNYFSIDQYAYTSDGEMRRFFSMSNPFENSLIIEDAHVVGMASIRESFENHGLIGGPKAVTLAWYELF